MEKYIYKAKLQRVVDGDTVDAQVDLGFDIHKIIRIRLVGINAPESRTRDLEEKVRGLAAKARVKELLKEHKNIFILKSQGEIKLNDILITEGHAVAYHGGKR